MKRWQILAVVAATVLSPVVPAVSMASRPAGAATSTIVSLTFDDGFGSQSVAPAMLDAHGMKGTFYVNSNTIGIGGFLSWANLTDYQADGHEIAGHTLDHLDLSTIPIDQASAQICQDRTNLISHGINATDFAYPYGHGYEIPAVVSLVKSCGYSSARRANGLFSSDPECGSDGCGYPYAGIDPARRPVRHRDRRQRADARSRSPRSNSSSRRPRRTAAVGSRSSSTTSATDATPTRSPRRTCRRSSTGCSPAPRKAPSSRRCAKFSVARRSRSTRPHPYPRSPATAQRARQRPTTRR